MQANNYAGRDHSARAEGVKHRSGVCLRAFFSVYYYTKCVLLKAGRATLKTKMCNIKLATQTIAYIIWCKTVANALKINVLDTKTSSASGGFAHLIPHRGLCPLDLRWGLCPQTPVIGSHSPSVCVLFKKMLRIGPGLSVHLSVCLSRGSAAAAAAGRIGKSGALLQLGNRLGIAVRENPAFGQRTFRSFRYTCQS